MEKRDSYEAPAALCKMDVLDSDRHYCHCGGHHHGHTLNRKSDTQKTDRLQQERFCDAGGFCVENCTKKADSCFGCLPQVSGGKIEDCVCVRRIEEADQSSPLSSMIMSRSSAARSNSSALAASRISCSSSWMYLLVSFLESFCFFLRYLAVISLVSLE